MPNARYDISPETLHDLEDARFFIEFFSDHAERVVALHGANSEFHKSRLTYAFMQATRGLAGMATDIDGSHEAASEPDNFKRCGYICFWLRRAKPFVYALPVRQFREGSKERNAQSLFCRHHNEVFAFDLMFRICAAYESAARGDPTLATASLDRFYLNDVCVSLTNNSVSPQSMYLVYRSLFETVGR
jgi:hypothetical protein